MRPRFLDQPYSWNTTRRTAESEVDLAYAGSHHPSARSWILSDLLIAVVLVGVIAALCFGVLK